MTGESDELRKAPQAECWERMEESLKQQRATQKVHGVRKHELPSPILQSGTSIAQGEGTFLCLMVGESSCLGQIMAQMEKRDEKTPLQEKLEEMAEDIGKLGTIFAILTFHVLMIRFIFEGLYKKHVNLFGTVPMKSNTAEYYKKKSPKTKADSAAPATLLYTGATKKSPVCSAMATPPVVEIKGVKTEIVKEKEHDGCEAKETLYPKGCT